MKTMQLGKSDLQVSSISVGCMRINSLNRTEAEGFFKTAIEDLGINFFDHADIYGGGASEEIFAQAVKDAGIPRDKLIVQTKCGVRKGFYDLSKDYIISSLDNSLERLNTDYVDVFLLHRPDTLIEPEEIAEAFASLHKAGKVKSFGVSNHNSGQIRLLNKYLDKKYQINVNQLQFSPAHTGMIDVGLNVNMTNSIDHDGGILDFCRLEEITIQTWSPFMYGYFEGVFLGSEKYPQLNEVINDMASEKNVEPGAVVIAWILRHPARMQATLGTPEIDLLKSACKACTFDMSREEWYRIYCAAGNKLP